jgi:hypothetical protein
LLEPYPDLYDQKDILKPFHADEGTLKCHFGEVKISENTEYGFW